MKIVIPNDYQDMVDQLPCFSLVRHHDVKRYREPARDLDQLVERLGDADVVLLDNFDIAAMRQAVAMVAGRLVIEASGGITLDSIAEIAATGVDYASSGALTHSAPALDVGLDIEM